MKKTKNKKDKNIWTHLNVGWVHCTKGHYGLRKYFDMVPLVSLSQRWKLETFFCPLLSDCFKSKIFLNIKYFTCKISHLSKSKQPLTNWQNAIHHHSIDHPYHQQIRTKPPTSTLPTTQIHVLEREKKKKKNTSQSTTHRNPQSQPPPCPSHPTKIHKPNLKIEIGKP